MSIPLWQQLTGFSPETESNFTPGQRDAGIRTLLAEVDRMAREEFARGTNIPAGERTIFWDPLERICRHLGISRTKLSAYARELTGLRAHELTDRIKAANLPELVQAYVEIYVLPGIQEWVKLMPIERLQDPSARGRMFNACIAYARQGRSGVYRAGYAVSLGFANPSRLNRACLLAHGKSLDQMEAEVLRTLVQKFVKELLASLPAAAPAAKQAAPTKSGANKERRHPRDDYDFDTMNAAVDECLARKQSAA